ncbi:unnamed protein product [Rotaria sp. Silwood2]|nr:unnamed protein product [Rotaria sp. Silwood2]CAF4073930.1 unnamed protein product [Rotaria sp. Silwood2]
MACQEPLSDRQGGSIQLIRCVTPTPEERNDPRYIPQLEINKKAQQIISERFNAPISIIVYVGHMGVGKSRLASLTVAALEKGQHDPSLDLPEFACSDADVGDDVTITKEQWIERVFIVNEESNHLSASENQRLKAQYEFTHRIPPEIDAINIDYLPRALLKNTQTLDIFATS